MTAEIRLTIQMTLKKALGQRYAVFATQRNTSTFGIVISLKECQLMNEERLQERSFASSVLTQLTALSYVPKT